MTPRTYHPHVSSKHGVERMTGFENFPLISHLSFTICPLLPLATETQFDRKKMESIG